MQLTILMSSPNREGLTARCAQAAQQGAHRAGAPSEIIRLCDTGIAQCKACDNGWGDCREQGICRYASDGFGAAQAAVRECDALALVTPVYWGDMSEPLKAFADRLRRCEALRRDSAMRGKPVLLVAAPGGSGNGGLSCLTQMERLCQHMGAKVFDAMVVNRWNHDYLLPCIAASAQALSEGREHGKSI